MSETDATVDTEQPAGTEDDDEGAYWLGTPADVTIEVPVFLTGLGTGMIGTTLLSPSIPNQIILTVAILFIIMGIIVGVMYNK